MTEDSGAIFDAHVRAEFVARDVDATMATMTDAPYVTHVPVLTGGHGRDEVRAFYTNWFVGRWPADTQVTQISRTVGQGRVIDELIASFPRCGNAGAVAWSGADRPQGHPAARRAHGHRRRQGCL
jgi:hypothetical protein